MDKVVVVSGGFDPLHSGHVHLISEARKLGDTLVVALNSDNWLSRKKGKPFLPFAERKLILETMRNVDRVLEFNDDDGTAINALEILRQENPYGKVIFANGGDRTSLNVPELVVPGVIFQYGVGGDGKANSSSQILSTWTNGNTQRDWGWWSVVKAYPGAKVKELVVNPSSQLSKQRHQHRKEIWTVLKGTATVELNGKMLMLDQGQQIHIEVGQWHQLINKTHTALHILEIQLGNICDEDDIERSA